MKVRGDGPPTDWRTIDRWDHGVGWIAYPDEWIERASHAIEVAGAVWVVDPIDVPGLDDLLAEFGDVAGVVTLVNRHTRDVGAIATRHDVAVHVAHWMAGVADDVDAPVELVRGELGTTGYRLQKIVDNPLWREAALYGEETGTLVVGDALGTAQYFLTGEERLGVHPALRFTPPKRLGRLSPERILVGHGAGVTTDARRALEDALDGTVARVPRLYARNVRAFLTG